MITSILTLALLAALVAYDSDEAGRSDSAK
jgi:hypothetical protein